MTNEPLLFPNLEQFVQYASQELPSSRIIILTNGLLLTEERTKRLLEAGIKELTINNYTKRPDTFPEKFFRIGKLCGPYGIQFLAQTRNIDEVLNSRGGTSPNKKSQGIVHDSCPYPFSQFNVNGRGLVSKCCADVLFKDPMGDVTKEKVLDIWNGENFQRVRSALEQGKREELEGCKECDFTGSTIVQVGAKLSNIKEVKE